MPRLVICVVLLSVTLVSGPVLGESWECGESVAQSGAFVINTDQTPCAFSAATPSDLVLVDTIWSPGSIKKHPIGQTVTLVTLPITRAFAQRFYIEAVDRSSGIGVMAGATADPGRLATVTGTIAAIDGEIVLDSPDVTLGEIGGAPKSLGMNSAALRLGIGLDPTGILARVWGKAISVPEGETYYLVSDGGEPFAVFPDGVPRPNEGSDVILTGIPGVATVGGQQVRVFRVNAQ